MLDGKAIIVTGAGGGLGEATARAMADHGARIVANDLGVELAGTGEPTDDSVDATVEAIRDAGGEAVASFGDVTDFDYVGSLVDTAAEEYGRVDGVVNYAGNYRQSMLFNTDPEDWHSIVEVHLTGHFNLLRHVAERWRDRYKDGDLDAQRSFLAVSSSAARGTAGTAHYSAAKAGVLGLMRTAARELDQYGVRVNAMMPGGATRLVPDEVRDEVAEAGMTPERVAPLPVVLMSDRAEDVTGWTFAIGGDTVLTASDPTFERSAIMTGGWTPADLAGTLPGLLEPEPRSKTAPGHLARRILRDRD